MISKVIFSGCLMIAVVAASFAQSSGPRVNLSLIVTDKNKKSVSTLRKEDVQVFEDKVQQTILSIEPDERPVDFALVIDRSGSLRSLLPSVVEAAYRIITNKQPADQFFIETFVSSDNIRKVQDFTGDTRILTDTLKSIYVEGGLSAILDGVFVAADHLAKHTEVPSRRKALILITDGEDRRSGTKLDEVLKQLRAQDIQVFVIGLITNLDDYALVARANPRDKAKKLLTTLAEESGGLAFFPKNKSELTDAAGLISAAQLGQFRITYKSSKEPTKTEFRKVEVKLISTSGDKLQAIAPRGYYVEAKDVTKKPTEPKSP